MGIEKKETTITRTLVITIFVTSLLILGIAYAIGGLPQSAGNQDGSMQQDQGTSIEDTPTKETPPVDEYEIKAQAKSAQHIYWELPEGLSDNFSLDLLIDEPYGLAVGTPTMAAGYLQTEYRFPLNITLDDRHVATAEVCMRYIENGDLLYFFSGGEADISDGDVLRLRWNVTERTIDPSREVSYITYGEKIDNATSQWVHQLLPVYASALAEGMTVELPMASMYTDKIRFGIVDVFTKLENNVFVEHIDLSTVNQVTVFDNRNVWTAELPLYDQGLQMQTEHWGVLSGDLLFNGNAESKDYEDIRVADLDRFRKMRVDGIYYEVPDSYVPYEPRAFWRVPAEHIGQRFIRSIREQEESGERKYSSSYLETLAIASMNHSLGQQTDGGYWLTLPQSNWLYGDYGVAAGFYDTRFSTDAALFLLDMSQSYDLPEVFEAVTDYADFLLWYAENHSFETENGGVLIEDYFHPTIAHQPTHVSLNHLVTEMNFLLLYDKELRRQQGAQIDEAYLQLAGKIRQAVYDTGLAWVKENADLWYAYLPDGTYGLQDYPHLTRNDLRLSVSLMQDHWEDTEDNMFRKLIYYKERYLKENGFPMW